MNLRSKWDWVLCKITGMGVVEEKVRQAAEEPKVVEALVRLPLELNL
jgi:hypothetical protein